MHNKTLRNPHASLEFNPTLDRVMLNSDSIKLLLHPIPFTFLELSFYALSTLRNTTLARLCDVCGHFPDDEFDRLLQGMIKRGPDEHGDYDFTEEAV